VDDIAAIAATIEARLAEAKQIAGGLMFACRIPDREPDFFACGGPAAETYWHKFAPASVIRDVEATRSLVAEILKFSHVYNGSDEYYSCTQATDPHEEGAEPGSGCFNERAGEPCDCGRDARVGRLLGIIAGRWEPVTDPAP
jgi:hypothetical protein